MEAQRKHAKPHYELWHTTWTSHAPLSPRVRRMIKSVEWTEKKIMKFILPGRRVGETGEKRAHGDSQWYLYKYWSVAKILDPSFLLFSSRFPSRFFLFQSFGVSFPSLIFLYLSIYLLFSLSVPFARTKSARHP